MLCKASTHVAVASNKFHNGLGLKLRKFTSSSLRQFASLQTTDSRPLFERPRKTKQSKKEVLRQQLRKQDWKIAQSVELKPTVNAHNKAIEFLAYQWKFKQAIAVFDALKENGLDPQVNTYNRVLKVYSQWRKPESAVQEFNNLLGSNLKPSLKTYTNLLIACARFPESQSWQDALALLKDIETTGNSPTAEWYNQVIAECSNFLPHAQQATDLYDDMKSRGIIANTETFNCLIRALGKAGKLSEAVQVFEDMKVNGTTADQHTFVGLIQASEVSGDSETAMKYFDELSSSDLEHSERSYTFAISSLGKAGKLDQALSLLEQMKKSHITPTIHTFNALITANFVDGNGDGALEIFDAMPMAKQRSTYDLMSEGFDAIGDKARSTSIKELMGHDINIGRRAHKQGGE